MDRKVLPRILSWAHSLVQKTLEQGEFAVDATIGNGHDTCFLAHTVGETGHVFGFDVQASALETTQTRLAQEGLQDRVTLWQAGHETMQTRLQGYGGKIGAVMFNFGYLPHGDPSLITHPETSLIALTQALALLRPFGVVSAVLYPAHSGGETESEALLAYAKQLSPYHFEVAWYQFLNKQNTPPSVLSIQKIR